MSDQSQNQDEDVARVRKHVDELREHFDSVQIFCTRYEGDEGTTNVHMGSGDFFARIGHVKDWIIAEDEEVRKIHKKDSE